MWNNNSVKNVPQGLPARTTSGRHRARCLKERVNSDEDHKCQILHLKVEAWRNSGGRTGYDELDPAIREREEPADRARLETFQGGGEHVDQGELVSISETAPPIASAVEAVAVRSRDR